MRAIEEGVVLQTGKPLPPVVIEDDGKAPRAVPYSVSYTHLDVYKRQESYFSM